LPTRQPDSPGGRRLKIGRLGAVDGLVTCAGVSRNELLKAHGDALWDAMLAVNLAAVFRLVGAAIPALRAA
jgi:3-oxoacyl-[acyl-carrier protein] reductase